jgi:hypothetical protein
LYEIQTMFLPIAYPRTLYQIDIGNDHHTTEKH